MGDLQRSGHSHAPVRHVRWRLPRASRVVPAVIPRIEFARIDLAIDFAFTRRRSVHFTPLACRAQRGNTLAMLV